jgi:UDP-glucose:(heptosyl)LPS alpha-1,3-glucosyltransferase
MNPPTPAPAAGRPRIAVLNRIFSPSAGGAERYSITLVERLAATHEIHVFAQTIDHQWPGVTYHQVSRPFARPRWINQLWYALATWQATWRGFDLVHSHENTWHGDIQTVHVRPVRFSLFDGRTGLRRLTRWVKIVLSPRLLTYLWLEAARFRPAPGRQVVVASTYLGNEVLACYPQVSTMMSVLTPGVSLPQALVEPAAARRVLGLPVSGRLLLFVANDYARKGLAVLLEALASLPPDVGLMVAGNPVQQAQFSEQARAQGLAGRVHFLGTLADLAPAYDAADCLAHPTLEDTFAMVVLEAMAHGLPVVVSGVRYCGISGLLQDRENALLLENPRDPTELARALSDALDSQGLRQRLMQAGRVFARHHQWSEVARRQAGVYSAAMQARRGEAD